MEPRIRLISMQLLILLVANHVEPFTITGKFNDDNNAGLARAISVLKRQEKRSVEHYKNPDNLLNGGAVTVEDVQDWLKTPKMEDENFGLNQDTFWNSGLRVKEIDSLLRRNVYPEKRTSLTLSSVLPRRHEIENTFDSRDFNDGSSISNVISQSIGESKLNDQEQSFSDNKQNKPMDMESTTDVDGIIALNTLTKEEFLALMKAIDKLQKQSEGFKEKAIKTLNSEATFKEIVDNNQGPESMKILQAIKDEEIKLTHDRVVPLVTMETNLISQNTPETRVLEKQKKDVMLPQNSESDEIENEDFVNELTLALQENVVEAVEKAIREEIEIQKENRRRQRIREESVVEWGVKNRERNAQTVKRNNKRSGSVLPALINDLFDDDDDDDNDDRVPLGLDKFVARIVKLEQEVDRLRLVSQLESLENDVLTDALNEASLGQSEETVTDLEFESLKEAISIEEAIQDLRKARNSNRHSRVGAVNSNRHSRVGAAKPGQLWQRKRGSTLGRELIETRPLPSRMVRDLSFKGQRATKDDIRRLLGQTYLMKDQETRQSGPQQASFLRPNLERRNLR